MDHLAPMVFVVTDYHFNRTAWAAARDGGRAADAVIRAMRPSQERFPCDLLRDLFGPLPFRPVSHSPTVLALGDGTARRLAEAIYEERTMPAGTLDTARLAILGDALLDAGCDDEELVRQCRTEGPHWRGCWALDLVLGKE
jgi:hypothetical protein